MASQFLRNMVDSLNPNTDTASLTVEEERRSILRLDLPFPALVRGVDGASQAFEEQTILDNLSADGLSLRLARGVEPGARLFIVVRLSLEPNDEAPAPRIALRGIVQRVEPTHDDKCAIAVMFTRYRFLYASAE